MSSQTHPKPPKTLSAVNKFAIVLGILLIIEGFIGLFNPMVFGILSTNVLHALIHLFLGFTGLYIGLRNHARKFSLYIGILLLAVAILYFIPATNTVIVDLLNVNNAVAYLNTGVGLLAILFALLTPKRVIPGPHHAAHTHHH